MALTAALYLAAGCLTFFSPWFQNYANAVSPSAGVGLGAVLLWGNWALPGIYIADLALHYDVFQHADTSNKQVICLLLPLSSVMQCWLGSFLAKRFADYPNELVSLRSIMLFFVLSGPVAVTFSSAFRVWALFYCGMAASENIGFSFLSALIAQSTGVSVFTPLFFIIFNKSHRIWRQRLFSVGVPVTVIFLLITVAFLFSQNKELGRLDKIISYQAESVKNGLKDEFNNHIEILSRLDKLMKLDGMNAEFFQVNVQTELEHHPDLLRVEWLRAMNGNNGLNFVSQQAISNIRGDVLELGSVQEMLAKQNINKDVLALFGRNQYLVVIPDFQVGTNSCQCLKKVSGWCF